MSKIISFMKELNYPATEKGICLGIAYMAERARSLGQFKEFEERLVFLSKLEEGTLKKELDGAKAFLKRLSMNSSSIDATLSQLEDEDKMFMTLEPFFWQISARMYPNKIKQFFNLSDYKLYQQHYSKKIEPLLYDKHSEDNALLPLKPPAKYFIHTKKDEKNSDSALLEFFSTIELNPESSMGLLIYSGNHAIHVFYDLSKMEWVVTNHDDVLHFISIEYLLPVIRSAFTDNNICNLVIEVYTDAQLECSDLLFQQLDNISHKSLTRMISEESINDKDSHEATALEVAIKHQLLNTVQALFASNKLELNGPKLLDLAVLNGCEDVVIELLKQYDDKKIVIPPVSIDVVLAIANSHINIVKILLSNANVRINGILSGAVEMGNEELVHAILNIPTINVNERHIAHSNVTPLYLAVQAGNLNLVKMLLKHDEIEVNETSITSSPLIDACQSGHLGIVCALLNHKNTKINYYNQFSGTALGNAIEHLRIDCVAELLKNPDIDVNVVVRYYRPEDKANENPIRYTGLALAIESGNIDIVKLLLNHPALGVNELSQVDGKRCSSLYLLIGSTKFNDDVKRELVFSLLAKGHNNTQQSDVEKTLVAEYLKKEYPSYNAVQPFMQFINVLEKKFQALIRNDDIVSEMDAVQDFIKINAQDGNPDLTSIHSKLANLLDRTIKNKLSGTMKCEPTFFSANAMDSLQELQQVLSEANNEARSKFTP